jgi:hypothetical protein
VRADDTAGERRHRRQEQHPPEPAVHHARQQLLGEQERRPQVDGVSAVPVLEGHLPEALPRDRHPGVVDQQVDRAEGLLDGADHPRRDVGVVQVAAHGDRVHPGDPRGLGQPGRLLLVPPVRQPEVDARAGEPPGQRGTDAAGRAGHERDPAVEVTDVGRTGHDGDSPSARSPARG